MGLCFSKCLEFLVPQDQMCLLPSIKTDASASFAHVHVEASRAKRCLPMVVRVITFGSL